VKADWNYVSGKQKEEENTVSDEGVETNLA